MGVLAFPVVAQLGNGSFFAVRDEDRVEAEAFGAARLGGDAACERAGAATLLAAGRHDHELAHVTRFAVLGSVQPRQQPADGIVAAGASGLDSRFAAERRHLDPGVLPQRPLVRLGPSLARTAPCRSAFS